MVSMDRDKFEKITIEDCVNSYRCNAQRVILHNGEVTGFIYDASSLSHNKDNEKLKKGKAAGNV